jgi:ADP-glucose pyrophosphorylase
MKPELDRLIRSLDYYDYGTSQNDNIYEIEDKIKQDKELDDDDIYPYVSNKKYLKEFLTKCLEQLETEEDANEE